MESKSWDIVIVGGGIMGSATAYYLTKLDPSLRVVVVEKDPSYTYASTALCMANVRIQFSLEENIRISQYAFEILDNFENEMIVDGERPNIDFHGEGNLFLVDEANRAAAERSLKLQQSLNCPVEWWTPNQIRDHYPLYEPTGYVGGTFGSKDGRLDAYALLMGFKAKARSQGAVYLKEEVVDIVASRGRVEGVRLSSNETLTAGAVINCAGPWARIVAASAGIDLPVQPTKRQVFAMSPAVKPAGPLPLTILPTTLYFRTETGGLLLVGKSFSNDPVGYDFNWDDKRFYDHLWPELAEFAPAFDTAKLMRGWAGLYAVNTLDGNAILGEWPELKGFYLANGFSGHGLQQGPAVGRYISELILGLKPSLDLSIFRPERILENKPLAEGGLV
ncbi:MAG: FAD-binding oxidoreductase [Pseudomonadota bacterium]